MTHSSRRSEHSADRPGMPANEALDLVRGVREPTPVLRARDLVPGHDLILKREDLGPTGSFKWRGALCACEAWRRQGAERIVTASTGNHGAAVAWAATRLGMAAEVVVPREASPAKCSNIEAVGGRLRRHGADLREAAEEAGRLAHGHAVELFVDGGSPAQLAGTGTIAHELRGVEAGTLIVPLACGALAGGVAAAVARERRGTRVVGVQAAAFSRLSLVFHGHADPGPGNGSSIADGLADDRLIEPALSACLEHVEDVVTVDEDELASAVRTIHGRCRILVEAAAAAPVAALRQYPRLAEQGPVVAILTGANIDEALARRLLRQREA